MSKQSFVVPHTVRAENERHAVSYGFAVRFGVLEGVVHHNSVGDFYVFFARDGSRFKPVGEVVEHIFFKPRFSFEIAVEVYEIGRVAVSPFVLHLIVYGVAQVRNNVVFGMIFFKLADNVVPHFRAVTAGVDL